VLAGMTVCDDPDPHRHSGRPVGQRPMAW
jgi:hypothetical protein